jgi:hypothetical protein
MAVRGLARTRACAPALLDWSRASRKYEQPARTLGMLPVDVSELLEVMAEPQAHILPASRLIAFEDEMSKETVWSVLNCERVGKPKVVDRNGIGINP